MVELPFASVSETIVTRAVIGALTLLTAATSGVAGYKIVRTMTSTNPTTAQAVEVPKEEDSRAIFPTQTPVPAGANQPIPTGTRRVDDDDKREYEMEQESKENEHEDDDGDDKKEEHTEEQAPYTP